MAEPLRVKKICPNCFSSLGVSVLLEKQGDYWVCPRCGNKYEEKDGMLRRVV